MLKKILDQVIILSTSLLLPNETYCKVISNKNINLISQKLKVSPLSVEIISIRNEIMPERYIRNMNFISFADQLKLMNASVCVVGVGGLGGIVIENLARIGIGHFRLIDGDIFENSNLNRQLLSSPEKIGKSKVVTAKQHISRINPSAVITIFNEYLNVNNSEYLLGDCQITIDCLDNIESRFVLEDQSKKKCIPMVSASVAGTIGHVTTIFPQDKGLELIFGKRINLVKNKGEETILGCISYSVSTIGSIECNEVVKIILGKKTLRNKLLVLDMEDYTLEVLSLI